MSSTSHQPIVVTHEGGARFAAQIRSHRVVVDQPERGNPNRIGAFVARVVLPAPLPAAYVGLLERVARNCPAHETLTHRSQVLVTIETPTAAAA
jgi:hypothetical protein